MKKAIALFLLLVLALSLASCGKSNNDEKTICINCDAKNAIDAKFCSACGKSLDNIDDDEKNEEDDNTPTPETAICVQCESECPIGHSYCEEHECEKEACIMQKKSNSKFCVAHSCIYCGYERFGDLAWCSVHNCYWSGCKNTNATSGKSYYCLEHKCLVCDKGRTYGSDYCTNHDQLD